MAGEDEDMESATDSEYERPEIVYKDLWNKKRYKENYKKGFKGINR